jgi:hypothetical protein
MSTVQVDTINESTTASGVTIDGVLIKDGEVDGVDVSAIVSGSLVKLSSATASNDASLTLDDFVDLSNYPSYYIVLTQILAATDNVELRFNFRTGGGSGSDLTGSYLQGGVYWHGDATGGAIFENSSQTDYSTYENGSGNDTEEAIVGDGHLYPATGTAASSNINVYNYKGHKQMYNDTVRTIQRTTFHESTATVTGIKFFFSSGNIVSGTIDIYGVKS